MFDTSDKKPDNFTGQTPRRPDGVDNSRINDDDDDPFAPAAPRRSATGFVDDDADADAEGLGDADGGSEGRTPRRHRLRSWLAWLAIVLLAALGVAVWLRYFNPLVTDAVERGYISNVERRGVIFKTFEGEMVTERAIADTTRLYHRDFSFSVTDDSLARALQAVQATGRPVTVTYKRYAAPLPWRGASKIIVTDLQTK